MFRMRVSDCLLTAEAVVLLTIVRVGLRIVRYGTVRRLLHRYARGRAAERSSIEQVLRVVGAVAVVDRRLSRTSCLVNALAADAMLRRRGYASKLCLGVRYADKKAKRLEGHAWIEHRGIVVLGTLDNLKDYIVMSSPPLPSLLDEGRA
jgi:hypothetical protein